jgi:mRNA interferase MazF
LEPTEGDEMGKTRPIVVISDDAIGRLALRIVVPVTDWKDRYAYYPWMVRLEPDSDNGLVKSSASDGFQVRSVSLERFVERLGTLTEERVNRIVKSVGLCIRYPI